MHRQELEKALSVLRDGGTILTPTDTIWGISCDATSEEAVQKIVRLKQRQPEKSFIVLLDADYKLEQYLGEVPAVAYDLIEYAEKPLTIIFEGARRLAPGVINKDGSVGIRVVKQAGFCRRLLERFKKPLVSTSANLSGQPAPRTFSDIPPEITGGVDYVVPFEERSAGSPVPSTIVRLGPGGEYTLIRK